jgi:hypothetical protein
LPVNGQAIEAGTHDIYNAHGSRYDYTDITLKNKRDSHSIFTVNTYSGCITAMKFFFGLTQSLPEMEPKLAVTVPDGHLLHTA